MEIKKEKQTEIKKEKDENLLEVNSSSGITRPTNQIKTEKNTALFSGPRLFGNILNIKKESNYPNDSLNKHVSFYQYKDEMKKEKNLTQIKEEESINSNLVSSNIIKDSQTPSNQNLLFLEETNNQFLPKLQNIVSTANLKCILDLREIALKVKNAEYNPKRFAAVIMRIKEPKATALIFSSGKMVCTGARTEEESKQASKSFAKIILKLGYPVKFTEFQIQNIVASCDVKFPIRLEGLATKYIKFSNYEPDMFPGLIFHMLEPKIVLLIFVSGKIVLTGAKLRSDIYLAYKNILPMLHEFKKKDYNNNCAISTDQSNNLINTNNNNQ